jgi:hypothetical protein
VSFVVFGVNGEKSLEEPEMDLYRTPGGVAIYVLIDPRDRTVRYVGASVDPWRRLDQHILQLGHRPMSKPKYDWFIDMCRAGVYPEVQIVQVAKVNMVREAEKKWITFYSVRGELTNSSRYIPYTSAMLTMAASVQVAPVVAVTHVAPADPMVAKKVDVPKPRVLNVDLRLADHVGSKVAHAI